MDAMKFLGDDPAKEGKGMADALHNRLMIQVQEYTIEGPGGEDVNPELIIKKIEENGGKPGEVEELFTMTHIFFVRHMENDHDPNKSTNMLKYGSDEAWTSLLKKEGAKK